MLLTFFHCFLLYFIDFPLTRTGAPQYAAWGSLLERLCVKLKSMHKSKAKNSIERNVDLANGMGVFI